MKVCAQCKETLPEESFYKTKAQPSGYDSYCKLCKKQIAKDIRERTKELVNAKRRKRLREDAAYRKHVGDIKKRSYWRNIPCRMFYSVKSRCKSRNIVFALEKSDIVIPDKCPLLGIKFDKNRYSPTLDRIKPELGYIKGNVQVISKKANTMKNDASFAELMSFSKNIKKYLNLFDDIVQPVEN